MIQKEVKNTMITNNTNQSHGFTIDTNNAKAYQILADGIYRYKIAAVVRELMANCYDSHVASGNKDVPFRVKYPTSVNPVVEFEDYGLGMDDETISEVYTSFFTSTKTNSNEVIGALGLGSKTPLAYTQGFSVRSRKDGYERTYNVYKGASGKPDYTLVHQGETDRVNGTVVSIPVKDNDFREFRRYIEFYSNFYDIEVNLEPENVRSNFVSDISAMREKDYFFIESAADFPQLYREEVLVLMGSVPYPVRGLEEGLSEIESDVYAHLTRGYSSRFQTLVLNFGIGELDISASRESLSEDPETKKCLRDKMKSIIGALLKEYEDEYEAIDNPKELYSFYTRDCVSKNIVREKSESGDLAKKGVGVFSKVEKLRETHPILTRISTRKNWMNTRIFSGGSNINGDLSHYSVRHEKFLKNEKKLVIVEPSGKSSAGMIKSSREYSKRNPDCVVICALKPLRKCLKDSLNSDLAYAGIEWLSHSDIKVKTEKSQKTSEGKEDNQLDACLYDKSGDHGKKRLTIDDPEKFRFAVRSSNWRDRIVIDDTEDTDICKLLHAFEVLTSKDIKVVYMNSSNISRIKKLGIKPLADEIKHLRETCPLDEGTENLTKVVAMVLHQKGLHWTTNSGHDRAVERIWGACEYDLEEVKEYCDSMKSKIKDFDDRAASEYISSMSRLHGHSNFRNALLESQDEMEDLIQKTHNKYPLLGLKQPSESDKIAYVELINKTKTQKGEAQ